MRERAAETSEQPRLAGAGASCPRCRGRGWVVGPRGEDGSPAPARRCDCGARRRNRSLQDHSGIPERYKNCGLEDFDVAGGGPQGQALERARAICEHYVEDFLDGDGAFATTGLVFIGDPGTGKTHLAVAVLRSLIRRYGVSGRFVDFTTLVHRIQSSFDPQNEESRGRLLDPLIAVDVLVLDELGAQKPTPFVRDLLYLVINGRYAKRRPTLFTTNFPLERSVHREQRSLDRGADPVPDHPWRNSVSLGERIGTPLLSRLCEMARPIDLADVGDYRRDILMHQVRT